MGALLLLPLEQRFKPGFGFHFGPMGQQTVELQRRGAFLQGIGFVHGLLLLWRFGIETIILIQLMGRDGEITGLLILDRDGQRRRTALLLAATLQSDAYAIGMGD